MRGVAAVLLAAVSSLMAPATPAHASGCAGTPGCAVYRFKATLSILAKTGAPAYYALGATDAATAGSPVVLRPFSLATPPYEQFTLTRRGQLVLGGTSMCVTSHAPRVVLERCSGPLVSDSQHWADVPVDSYYATFWSAEYGYIAAPVIKAGAPLTVSHVLYSWWVPLAPGLAAVR